GELPLPGDSNAGTGVARRLAPRDGFRRPSRASRIATAVIRGDDCGPCAQRRTEKNWLPLLVGEGWGEGRVECNARSVAIGQTGSLSIVGEGWGEGRVECNARSVAIGQTGSLSLWALVSTSEARCVKTLRMVSTQRGWNPRFATRSLYSSRGS